MFTKKFWKDAFERVISTAAQAAAGVVLADTVKGLSTESGLTIIGTAAALSLLKALAAGKWQDNSVSPASLAK